MATGKVRQQRLVSSKGQLYSLADNPGETRNLYNQHPQKVAELRQLLEQCELPSDASRSLGFSGLH